MVCMGYCFSQTVNANDSIQPKVEALEKIYKSNLWDDAHLFNGIEYIEYKRNTHGHPYYLTPRWTNGSVEYAHQIYKDVPLIYDIFTDKVIVKNLLTKKPIQLIDENIKGFKIEKKAFTHLKETATNNIATGYYEVLYDGQSKLFVKRKKTILEKVLAGDYQITFEESSTIYVCINGSYSEVNSKKGLKKILKTKKKEIKKFIATSRSKFREDFEGSIVETLKFYDGIDN
jgi:hypothetical protein